MKWAEKMRKVYHDILRNLWFAGQDEVTLNGRNFRLMFEDATETVEVRESVDGNLDFVLTLENESELGEWVEYLCVEEMKKSCPFLLSMSYPGENGQEWACKVCSLAEIARTIGCSDFNETSNHRVFVVVDGIPEEIEWTGDHRHLCIDFGTFGSYEYPDH